jgi:hypothetical protein
MRTLVIGLAALLVLAGVAVVVFFVARPPPPEPPAAAIEQIPIVPAPPPAPAPTPKRADLPTVEVGTRPVHAVPEGEPPPAKPVTLRSRDGRVIDPASGRSR